MKKSTTQVSKKAPLPQHVFHLADKLLIKKQTLFNDLAQGRTSKNPYKNGFSGYQLLGNTQTNRAPSVSSKNSKRGIIARIIALPAYHWVLLSQFFVVLPLMSYLPMWLIAFTLFSIVMQLPNIKYKIRQRADKRTAKSNKQHDNNEQQSTVDESKRQVIPSYRPIQLIGFFGSLGGLWLSYGGFNVESGIAFLLLCLAGKLWELYQKRDALVLLNLSFFVTASLFLLDKGLVSGLQVLLSVMMILMAFIAINDDIDDMSGDIEASKPQNEAYSSHSINGSGRVRSVLLLTGLAIPLLVVLFIFFPRMPPLWTLQLSSGVAKTGVSDSMSPGDFSQLSKSSELAFRVEFEGDVPALADMYWRGLVFSDFDGTTWQQNKSNLRVWQHQQPPPTWLDVAKLETSQTNQQVEVKNQYKIILEATNNDWLYALEYPFETQPNIALTSNYTLLNSFAVSEQFSYNNTHQPMLSIDLQLTYNQQQINLDLPNEGNEESRKLAKKLYSQSSSVDDYIGKITNWINKSEFYYTLSPPKLGENRIDDFLFNTKSGFCEHYASSFVFLMRAAGVPSRVVVGYQGGTVGRDGNSWEIRQMDAHAWTEVWIETKGWTRVDPTAFVAPDRVERGMSAMAEQSGASMFGSGMAAQMSYQQFKMLEDMRRLSDQMSYYWQKNIVGYDEKSQSNKLFKWFNIKGMYKQVLVMIVIAMAIFSLIAFWLWFRQRQIWHSADKPLIKLNKKIAKKHPNLVLAENEGLLSWLQRVQNHADFTENTDDLSRIQIHYRTLRYGRLSTEGSEKTAEYKQMLQQLNTAIKPLRNKAK